MSYVRSSKKNEFQDIFSLFVSVFSSLCCSGLLDDCMIDVTITIAGLHDRTACDLLEFLRCYCKCFQSFGFKTDD